MRTLYDMVDESMPFDNWRKLMLIKCGYFTSVGKVDIKGTVTSALIPESLAYEKMDDIEFRKCMNNFIQQFIDKYGRGMTYDELSKAASLLWINADIAKNDLILLCLAYKYAAHTNVQRSG